MLLGIRLPGTTFWSGLSNHQAASAQMHLVGRNIVECRPTLGALPLSLKPGSFGRPSDRVSHSTHRSGGTNLSNATCLMRLRLAQEREREKERDRERERERGAAADAFGFQASSQSKLPRWSQQFSPAAQNWTRSAF